MFKTLFAQQHERILQGSFTPSVLGEVVCEELQKNVSINFVKLNYGATIIEYSNPIGY